MAINYNGNNVSSVVYNSQTVNKVIKDGVIVWEKPFTYTTGTLPTGVASITCTRANSYEPTAATGVIAAGGTIYYEDVLYTSGTAARGYNAPSGTTISSVTGNVVGANYITAGSRLSYTYTAPTITGVSSYTCYRKLWNGSSWSAISSGTTIYYGDQLYWSITATTEYDTHCSYTSSSSPLTVTSAVAASSYISAERKQFTYTAPTITGISSYVCYRQSYAGGSWSQISSGYILRYGDKVYWTSISASSGYTAKCNYTSESSALTVTDTVNAATYITASESSKLVAPSIKFSSRGGGQQVRFSISNSSIPSGTLYYKYWYTGQSEPSTYSSTSSASYTSSWMMALERTYYVKAYVVNTLGTSSVTYEYS